jgi:conjugal transfer pilus assembly protein TraV
MINKVLRFRSQPDSSEHNFQETAMKNVTFLLAGSVLLLTGCAGVKSSFDCDATTSDTCMTMTKANQLARDKAAKQAGKPAAGGLPSLVNLPATSAAVLPSASRSAVSTSSRIQVTSNEPAVSVDGVTGKSTNAAAPTLTPRLVAGTPVTPVSRPAVSVGPHARPYVVIIPALYILSVAGIA